MKQIVFILLVLGGAGSGAASAQQVQEGAFIPARRIEYFNKEREPVASAESAYYRVETTYRDSISGTVREFYPSGKVKEIRPYAHVRKQLLHGSTTTWYESGKLRAKQDFYGGKRQGELVVYYPDGTLRRRDQFVADKRTNGECFGPDGKSAAYFEYEQMPVYPGGFEGLLRQVARTLRYPGDALQAQLQGKVIVDFLVGEDGAIRNARIVKGLSLSMDREALRVINSLGKFTPAQLDGEAVPVAFTVPINFAIN